MLPFSLEDPVLRNPRKTQKKHRNDRFGRDPENTRKKLSGDLAGRPKLQKQIPPALELWGSGL